MILIVDDDELNRDVLSNIFSLSYPIVTAENGREGLEMLEIYRNELCGILLDMVMPVMDGIAVLKELQKTNVTAQIPVFLITGETGGEFTRKAYELGVMDVIAKPVVPHVVKRRVNSVIELYEARKRLNAVVDLQKNKILQQAKHILKLSMGMIESLSTAIEFRSGETGDHVRRIHDITDLFLRQAPLGHKFSDDAIREIGLASIMHDVGKIAVSDAILNKPGKLTPEEYEIMKSHTVKGGELLERIPQIRELSFFNYAYDIARHHHERWDGRGYPDGLVGDAITPWAQVVSIADVYDALVCKRVYKKPFDHDTALGMISDGKCGLFNPELVTEFRAIEPQIRQFYIENENESVVH